MAKFPIGIIGCGRISQSYIEAIRRSSLVSLKSVYDIRLEAANAVAEQEKADCFHDFEHYLEKSNVEASIILTPPSLHKEIACALLENGQHVLCEKPLATTLREGVDMLNSAKRNQKLLMMASKFRYVEDIIRTKSMISTGIIGKPVFIENCFSGHLDMRNRWNANEEISGGGVLIDNGTHSVDLIRYLTGPIELVHAIDISTNNILKVEDTVSVSFKTKNQVKGSISLSWNIPLIRKAYISVYGTEGSLLVDWHSSNYQHINSPEWVSFGVGYDKIEAFQRQVENFVASISGKEVPLISWKDSLSSIAVIEAAYRSLSTGKWEEVGPYDPLD